MSEKDWFIDWFNTSYYHILYQNRNESEAKEFIINLMNHLELESESNILDLACGKGRHSKTLNELGFEVLGVDLSENSIIEAQKWSSDSLSFEVHDMRYKIENRQFNAIFNLFTSFGYFDTFNENQLVCEAMHQMLEVGGKLVIDFMNVFKVISSLVREEEKKINEINFKISRNHDDSHIFKHIKFVDQGNDYHFTERVQVLRLEDFQSLLEPYFIIEDVFGSLDLQPFILEKSDRLIIIASRKK
ncbi:class I SAM-dependent methyltransferase [Crocinitomicaceae bacterium]|nr:class I SAM-dependent methyltransferase [Crocinitomicaceae bacterium]MDC1203527.1 class I SAM-dependent methyltransferase [Crocinitomicaceae bacterium]